MDQKTGTRGGNKIMEGCVKLKQGDKYKKWTGVLVYSVGTTMILHGRKA
jgi:hypothetical protein